MFGSNRIYQRKFAFYYFESNENGSNMASVIFNFNLYIVLLKACDALVEILTSKPKMTRVESQMKRYYLKIIIYIYVALKTCG